MKRSFFAMVLVAIAAVAAPQVAYAQHSAPAGAASTGTAVPAGGSSGGSSSTSSPSSSSSGGSSDGGNSIRSFSGGGHRGGGTPNGRAVPRTGQPGTIAIGGGFYPFGYTVGGGFGLGIDDGFYGGYYGAYDPWYGFAPVYAPSSTSSSDESGAIRLKVKPSDASVYVDGYFAGVVDDFDGVFQRLHLSPGPHRLEIRAADHNPLSLDVWITEGLTITYQGDLGKP